MKKRVAFLVPYSLGIAPSQRFRVEQYLPFLKERNVEYKIFPFLDEVTNKILYQNGKIFLKLSGVIKGFIRRFVFLFLQSYSYDIIFIHREASPIGPPIFEWILVKIFRKKIIFDFDDAIWLPTQKADSFIQKFKNPQKTNKILSWSNKILAGNEFLKKHAETLAKGKIILLPTVVDTVSKYHPSPNHTNRLPVIVGWTGSHSTFPYLAELIPLLNDIYKQYSFTLYIISDQNPTIDFPDYQFIQWRAISELEDLHPIDIGIMPMKNDLWSKGKCGFKLIQYGALGIPSVADYTEANAAIVLHGQTGFICQQKSDWKIYLSRLIEDSSLRKSMGASALEQIRNNYSLERYSDVFLKVIS